MKKLVPRFASWQPMPPVSATSSAARFRRLTVPTAIRVVPAVASCWKLTGRSIWMSSMVPAVVSILTPQSPTTGTFTGMSVIVFTRARTVTSSRLAPCAGLSSRRGASPGNRLKSMLIGPQGFFGTPPGQHVGVLPEQLTGALNWMTPFIPPATLPISAAGSAAIVASPVCETRTWTAFGLRLADGKPPGIGSNVEHPPHPPPLHDTANTSAVITTTQSRRRRLRFIGRSPRSWG